MNEPLRVGVLGVRGVPSTYSGYETFLTALLPELVARGHQVTCYSRDRNAERTWRGVDVVPLPSLPSKSLETLSHSAIATVFARLRGKHDVLLTCNVATALFSGFANATGLPVVINVDGVEWDRGKWGSVARKTFRAAARASKFTATTLIADCQSMADIYKSEFGAESTVIPYCWTGLIDDLQPAERKDLVREFGVEPGKYCIVAGRMNPENNIGPIVQSYVDSDFAEPLIVLGGANYDSPVFRDVERCAAVDDRIQFRGHVEHRELYGSLLSEATLMFHGHSVGGMNPGLVEAMGSGALIAAFDTRFNRDTLDEAGVYFSDPTTAAIEARRELAIRDSLKIRTAASSRSRSEFSLDRVASQYEEALLLSRG